ncbi:MAG: hypothetical protein MK077_04835 [Phycisphaerales bacterium]|nr:hypothetical protein [Phycisphaerales bacterium]
MADVPFIHLVDGPTMQSRPCLASMVQAGMDTVGGEVVCLKTGITGSSVVISQHGRPVVTDAARTLGSLMDHHQAKACVAWDIDAMAVLVASGRRGLAVLDDALAGLTLPPDGVLRAGAADCNGMIKSLPPWVSLPEIRTDGESILAIIAEPFQQGTVSWCEHLLGRWHLLGSVPPVVLGGRTSDQQRLTKVLHRVGLTSVRLATLDNLWPRLSAESVVLAATEMSGGVAPAVRAWASGATVVLPSGHAAAALLAGHEGVLIESERDLDVTVGALRNPSKPHVQSRQDIVAQWNDDWCAVLLTACQAIERIEQQPVHTAV